MGSRIPKSRLRSRQSTAVPAGDMGTPEPKQLRRGRKSNSKQESQEVDQRRQDDFDGKWSLGTGSDRAGTPKEGRVRDRSECELTWGPGGCQGVGLSESASLEDDFG